MAKKPNDHSPSQLDELRKMLEQLRTYLIENKAIIEASRTDNSMINCFILTGKIHDFIKRIGLANMIEAEINDSDYSEYDQKLKLASTIRELLARHDLYLSMKDPESPKRNALFVIYAIPSKDGEGRFVFENRRNKKRQYTTKDLKEPLYPIKLAGIYDDTNDLLSRLNDE